MKSKGSDPKPPPLPGGDPGKPTEAWRAQWGRTLLYLVFAFLMVWFWQESVTRLTVRTIPYSEFKQHLARGEVVECSVKTDMITGRIAPKPEEAEAGKGSGGKPPKKEAAQETADEPFAFRTVRVKEDRALVEQLLAAKVKFSGERPNVVTQLILAWLLPIGLILFLWFWIGRRIGAAGQSMLSIGKSRARLAADKETGVRFGDVAGCDEAKFELQEVVEFLKNPEKYRTLGARIPKGVLLVGPPGTGKTLLARAVAGEAGVPFFSISGSDFVEMFVGVGAARVRDLFQQAKAQAPAIVFIDELDAIGRQRGVNVGSVNDEREQTLNQLLVEMDGFTANVGVIILSATNRPEVLDRALLRPGRFDRQVVVDAPDLEGRLAILKVHAKDKPLAGEVDLRKVARGTPGFSGADLANTLNEAALLAARRNGKEIRQADLEEAVEKVVAGPERRSRKLLQAKKRRVAYHEVGHALVATFSKHADPVHKISIIPRGNTALGYTLQLPSEENYLVTRPELLDRIRGLLGGRAAEEIVFVEVSTGAENDLDRATALARQMVCYFGMSDTVGLVHYGQRQSPFHQPLPTELGQRECSEATAREVDQEVKRILQEAYDGAKQTLQDHRAELERVTEELLQQETLDGKTFQELISSDSSPSPPA